MRNLAKSLHTITALVNVAKHLDTQQAAGVSAFRYANVKELVEHAAIVLGLYGMPDVYGLKEKAAAQLKRQIETNDTEELNTPNVRVLMDVPPIFGSRPNDAEVEKENSAMILTCARAA